MFSNQQDKRRILYGPTWTFDSQYLILQPWVADTDYRTVDFHTIALWVQVWNLPPHWISTKAGFRFKNLFENILDVYIPEHGSKKRRCMKILVKIDLRKPLLRGANLSYNDLTV